MKTKQIETSKGLLDVVVNNVTESDETQIRISLNENFLLTSTENEYLVVLFKHAVELIKSLLKREPLPLPEDLDDNDIEGLIFVNPKNGSIAMYFTGDGQEEFEDEIIFNDKLNSIEFSLINEEGLSSVRNISLLDYGYECYKDVLKDNTKNNDSCQSLFNEYYYIGNRDGKSGDIQYEIQTTLLLLYRCLRDKHLYWNWGVENKAERHLLEIKRGE